MRPAARNAAEGRGFRVCLHCSVDPAVQESSARVGEVPGKTSCAGRGTCCQDVAGFRSVLPARLPHGVIPTSFTCVGPRTNLKVPCQCPCYVERRIMHNKGIFITACSNPSCWMDASFSYAMVPASAGRPDFSAQGIAFVEAELANAKQKFHQAQNNRSSAISRVKRHEVACIAEENAWLEMQKREQKRDEAARRLQSWWLRVGICRTKTFPLHELLEHHRLLRARQCLGENLLELRRCVHDLHVEEADRQQSALKMQQWWRRILARRVMKIIAMYGKVSNMKRIVEAAAAKIQAIVRGISARREVSLLRETRRVAEEEAAERLEQIKMQAVLSIQNTYRKSVAVKQVQLLRARMFAAVMSQGVSDAEMGSPLRSKLQPLGRSLKGVAKASPKKKR